MSGEFLFCSRYPQGAIARRSRLQGISLAKRSPDRPAFTARSLSTENRHPARLALQCGQVRPDKA